MGSEELCTCIRKTESVTRGRKPSDAENERVHKNLPNNVGKIVGARCTRLKLGLRRFAIGRVWTLHDTERWAEADILFLYNILRNPSLVGRYQWRKSNLEQWSEVQSPSAFTIFDRTAISPVPTALTNLVINPNAITRERSLLILRYTSMLPSAHTRALARSISPYWSLTAARNRTRFPTSWGGSASMLASSGYSFLSASTCDTLISSI